MRPEVWVSGRYVVVDRPNRLVMTWGFESPLPVPPVVTEVAPGSSTVEFTFLPDGDGTVIRVRHTDIPSEAAHQFHTLGWNNYLDRLRVVLDGGDPGDDPLIARDYTFPPEVG
jgi:uncharacterized protein YndB with AHSA1/START domain